MNISVVVRVLLLGMSLLTVVYARVPLYDFTRSFEENKYNGPTVPYPMPVVHRIKKSKLTLFGYPLTSPIGIASCALGTSKGIAAAALLGYDVLTYKTVRSHEVCPLSSWVYPVIVPELLTTTCMNKHVSVSLFSDTADALTNLLGMNSDEPEAVVHDIAAAKAALSEGQVLIVSIYGSGPDKLSMIGDFVAAVALACKGGAQIIEVNLSCPNVRGAPLYQQPTLVHDLCKALTHVFPALPLIIKVGIFQDCELMRSVVKAAARGGARGIVGINAIPMQVMAADGTPIFGAQYPLSGISGAPLRSLALQFVKDARAIIGQEQLDLVLFATGGVTEPEHFDELLAAGADIVLSATGAMLNAHLASTYHRAHHAVLDEHNKNIIKQLYQIGAIKLEDTMLKSGVISPFYCDMRVLMSDPALLHPIAQELAKKMKFSVGERLCGVPYGAVPLATAMALAGNIPLIMLRKEVKQHGTKKRVEGVFKPGDRCVVVEDVITTGGSVLETVCMLEQEGVKVHDIVIVLDREQGGVAALQRRGYQVHVLYTLSDILKVLLEEGLITHKQYACVKQFSIEHSITE